MNSNEIPEDACCGNCAHLGRLVEHIPTSQTICLYTRMRANGLILYVIADNLCRYWQLDRSEEKQAMIRIFCDRCGVDCTNLKLAEISINYAPVYMSTTDKMTVTLCPACQSKLEAFLKRVQ